MLVESVTVRGPGGAPGPLLLEPVPPQPVAKAEATSTAASVLPSRNRNDFMPQPSTSDSSWSSSSRARSILARAYRRQYSCCNTLSQRLPISAFREQSLDFANHNT